MLARITRLTLPALVLIAALAAYRVVAVGFLSEPPLALARRLPAAIEPRFRDERVVSNAQLAAVLERVKPPRGKANTNHFVHALRLWGPAADFGDASIPTGRDLLAYFLEDATFRRLAGPSAPALFYRTADGIDVRGYDDRTTDRGTSSYHTDDLLATLAESGVALDTPMHLRNGKAHVEDLLRTSLRRFHLERLEYEWTAIAYARYVFPEPAWRNKFGERIDVDALVAEIVSHSPELGPCNGLHRLEALAVLYRADEPYHTLAPRTKQKMLGYMGWVSQRLVAAQTSEGYWTRSWPRGAAAAASDKATPPSLHDKLLVTGHHLEWLALAPEEVQPPRETVIRAAQWLARTLVEMDDKQLLEAYGPYTHAARALALWRGTEAFAFWKNHHVEQASSLAHNR